MAGKRVIGVPIGAEAGGVPDPAHLRAALAEAAGVGARPGVLVLTLPDNPTGTVASEALVREVCEIAEAAGLLLVCDEIYRDLAYEPERFVSPAELLPERTFVTTGLSKSLALGGWRVGLVRLADGRLGEEAARRDRRRGERDLVGAGGADAVRRGIRARRAAGGGRARRREPAAAPRGEPRRLRGCPRGGPDLPPAERRLLPLPRLRGPPVPAAGRRSPTTCSSERGIAVLPGEAFGDDPAALRVRMATSLLYGDSDEQQARGAGERRPGGAAVDRRGARPHARRPRLLGLPARLDHVAVGVADLDADVVGLVPELDDLDARGRERVAQVPHRAGLLDVEAEVEEARQRRRPLGGAQRERDVARAVEHQHAVGVALRRLRRRSRTSARRTRASAARPGPPARRGGAASARGHDQQRDVPRVAHEQARGRVLVRRAGGDHALAQGSGVGRAGITIVQCRRPTTPAGTGGAPRPRQMLRPRWWW